MDSIDHRPRVAAERREKMRARLLDSALELVARQGPAATSIDDVISAAQVSRGTFYKYFDAPDALVRELALEVTNELMRTAEPLVLEREEPAERIATGMRLVIRLGSSLPALGAFIVRLGWPDLDRRHLLFDFVQRDVEEGLRRGSFTAMPVSLALNVVSGTVLGAIQTLLCQHCEPDFPEQAVASALRALGVAPKAVARALALPLARPALIDGGLLARAHGVAGDPDATGVMAAAERRQRV